MPEGEWVCLACDCQGGCTTTRPTHKQLAAHYNGGHFGSGSYFYRRRLESTEYKLLDAHNKSISLRKHVSFYELGVQPVASISLESASSASLCRSHPLDLGEAE
eukprot:1178156-Prorocentrum_minimum.AAC.5